MGVYWRRPQHGTLLRSRCHCARSQRGTVVILPVHEGTSHACVPSKTQRALDFTVISRFVSSYKQFNRVCGEMYLAFKASKITFFIQSSLNLYIDIQSIIELFIYGYMFRLGLINTNLTYTTKRRCVQEVCLNYKQCKRYK